MSTPDAGSQPRNLRTDQVQREVEEFVLSLVAERSDGYHWAVHRGGERVGSIMEEWDGLFTVIPKGCKERDGVGSRDTLDAAAELLRTNLADKALKTYARLESTDSETRDKRRARLAAELAAGATPTGGLVWGLPPLPDGDMWVDTAGVSALTGLAESSIRGRVHRSDRYSQVLPAPRTYFGLKWWTMSEITAWEASRSDRAGQRSEA